MHIPHWKNKSPLKLSSLDIFLQYSSIQRKTSQKRSTKCLLWLLLQKINQLNPNRLPSPSLQVQRQAPLKTQWQGHENELFLQDLPLIMRLDQLKIFHDDRFDQRVCQYHFWCHLPFSKFIPNLLGCTYFRV